MIADRSKKNRENGFFSAALFFFLAFDDASIERMILGFYSQTIS